MAPTYEQQLTLSFNHDFCSDLEFHLTRSFGASTEQALDGFWCDGVNMPFEDKQLLKANLRATQQIVTEVWLGITGQDIYIMTINLGPRALKNCIADMPLNECLPPDTSLSWVEVDSEARLISIQLG